MLLRVVLSMETLQLAGEGAKNKQEGTNYKKAVPYMTVL